MYCKKLLTAAMYCKKLLAAAMYCRKGQFTTAYYTKTKYYKTVVKMNTMQNKSALVILQLGLCVYII